jgi:hypothetical protein
MKKFTFIFSIILLLFAHHGTAQIFGTDPEIKINGLSQDNAFQVAEKALANMGFSVGKYDAQKGYLLSDWINWTTVAIKNRATLYFKFNNSQLILKVANRSYASKEGWSEAVGKLSKKKYKEYVQKVADEIKAIANNPDRIHDAVKTSKIIPAFNAINTLGNLKWKLLETHQTNRTGNLRPVLTFEVTNTGSQLVDITSYGGEFELISGVGTARIGIQWEKHSTENRSTTQFQPGETMKAIIEVGQGYSLETGLKHVLRLKFRLNKPKEEIQFLQIYHIPIPYTYKEED